MTEFTPVAGLIGGVLIGAAAVLLLAGIGRIAGISGILFGLLTQLRQRDEWAWRAMFLLGLVGGARLWFALSGATLTARTQFSPALLMAGGLLVGLGTSIGHGCTSGHGVCGLGRLSLRSLVATLVFLATAMVTVLVVRHGWPA
ncbi:YeeE/YedE family protein [Derxia lacustris]|uniref:YeeE/YedE family protein n=1 Tax=Derxia lacustris TaxID=764842 RepID=UPI000A1773E3|nr:YeeE/YedE thiosulfate transporter family protein [Derxia lacustris]